MADARMEAAVTAAGRAFACAAEQWAPAVRYTEEGRIVSSRDGVLHITGLPGARSEELLDIGRDTFALVLGLGPGEVLAAVLGDPAAVREGGRARATGNLATIAVGEALLGRVLDPLGRPLDGAPLTGALRPLPLERPAPPIYARDTVHRPLYTGTLAIDAMFPIGRGQRELVLGDEGTGRTSLAVTAMLRQRDTDVVCVYVAIGRRRTETWQVVDALRSAGGRWVVVSAPEDCSPGMRLLAPYAGTSVAEYFRDRGEHALIVYDELTAHAVAWRELCLLMGRPPGREAFPGDVFYLHSRLLERATQLSRESGGGSLTALPVATTEDGRLSAYIPTNLIAITDGQVVLSRPLFAGGQKPAIDASLSVSRVGGRTQAQALRRLSSRMRLDFAAFLELESFARVGTRLESSARARLDVGRRLRLLLRSGRLQPAGVFEQIAWLALANRTESLLAVPEDALQAFASQLPLLVAQRDRAMCERLGREAVLDDAVAEQLFAMIDAIVAERWPTERGDG